MGGKTAIGAATVGIAPIVGTPRIINLSARVRREAERGHKQRNNEPNRFHYLYGNLVIFCWSL
jgi:hypothetical protein